MKMLVWFVLVGLLVITTPVDAYDLNKGLIAYYSFDDIHDNILPDDSGNRNDGIIHGAKVVDGIKSKALYFDGIDDYVYVEDSDTLDITEEITIALWINIKEWNGKFGEFGPFKAEHIRGFGWIGNYWISSCQKPYGCYQENDFRKWTFAFAYPDGAHHDHWSNSLLELNKWIFLVATYDGKYVKLYHNGELDAIYREDLPLKPNNKPLTFGASIHNGKPYQHVNCIIDEVRIYNRALSDEQIKALYEQTIHPTPTQTHTPKPRLTLIIQTDTELKEGETRYSKLIVRNEGTAPAQNVIITLFSQGLNIQITENLGTLQPQESREIPFYVEAKYSGQYKVFAKAEYTDGLNKYIEETQKVITVRASEIPSLLPQQEAEKGKLSISLTTDVIKAKVGQEFAVTLSVVNYITNPDATLQIILKPPSGMSVTSAEFVQAGLGQYTAIYSVKSGEAKAIQILLKPNNAGEFVINGEVIYYFGNDKQNFQTIPISQRVIIEEKSIQTPTAQIPKQIPGFTSAIAMISMLLLITLKRRSI